MNKIKKRGTPLFFLILLMLLVLSIGSVSAANLDVGPSGYNYTSINQAINNATPGDTINVHDNNGANYTYNENIIVINKNISLLSKGKVSITQNELMRAV